MQIILPRIFTNLRLFREIQSRRDLVLGVCEVTILIVVLACLCDFLFTWFFLPDVVFFSLIKTVIIASSMSALFLSSVGLANYRLFKAKQKIEALSQTDALTGLLNRRCFFERADADGLSAKPAFLLLADIDRFKSINDAHGHPAGDAVLSTIGGIISSLFSPPHLAGRLGGEEFGILLVGLDLREAQTQADFLRLRVAAEHFIYDGRTFKTTMSIGIVARVDGLSASTYYQLADKALYRAKRGGRDRVEVWSPDPTSAPVIPIRSPMQ